MKDYDSLPPKTKHPSSNGRKKDLSLQTRKERLKKDIMKTERELSKLEKQLKENSELSVAVKGNILTEKQVTALPVWQEKKILGKKVIFDPIPGPQTQFLEAGEDEVLFAGARGGGKSLALVIDPLRTVTNKNFRALIVRKTMPELRDMIETAKDLYRQAYPGVKWKEQEKLFIFPSGAKIEFGHLENDSDVERYRGQQYTWIGIDELTLFGKEEVYDRLRGSLRTTDPDLKTYTRATSNPNGPGRAWVKRRFVDKAPSNVTFDIHTETPIGNIRTTRKWIDSRTTDNPYIKPEYLANLLGMPERLRKAWVDGDWNVAEGVAFPDFDQRIHVIKPFEVPYNWLKIRCCDWGFTSMAVCLWLAFDEDHNCYVYREYKTKLVDAPTFAGNVLQLERDDRVRYGIIDGSVGDQRGISGPTVDEQMRMVGCIWRYSDKSPGSRIAGKNLIHRYLSIDEHTKQPKLKIFDCCKELIEELASLPVDDNNAEDVDTDCDDHAYDAFRYGLSSRPNVVSAFDSWHNMNGNTRPVVIDKKFGY